ncbi:DUF4174 domain-containing protein [Thalassobaculum sp. OXR-137]|uniref:DUF4174 domain-containing protein n=1 Tax=Thalassobaculum sp. OXR-137 TaxID=3100173 RepID=UPI002AC99713|nr:DUF4174 domain-containing protein [Thalassobaculum sp. OXR-137]WPZ34604.1 DUF4174 domain-containing protein [Thalassobaculum sp. OXR-137]
MTLAGAGLLALTAGPAEAAPLDKYRWKRRLLLVFAPVKPHPNLVVQRQRLKEAADGLKEREVTVIEVVQDSVFVDGKLAIELNAKNLRKQFDTTIVEFNVVLIGKDGAEKLRRDEAVQVSDLFKTIDSMPMRQQEMRQRGQKT